MENDRVQFKVVNDTDTDLIIIHEPEAIEFSLHRKKNIMVEYNAFKDSILLSISTQNNSAYLQIWDGDDTNYRVLQNGKDVFSDL